MLWPKYSSSQDKFWRYGIPFFAFLREFAYDVEADFMILACE
jgi:hypothetical protein